MWPACLTKSLFSCDRSLGGLTTDALSKHDAVLGVSELRSIEDAVKEEEEDALSEGALTLGSLGQASFRTFATDFTQCTVPSFSK